jgi:hypothetical protein
MIAGFEIGETWYLDMAATIGGVKARARRWAPVSARARPRSRASRSSSSAAAGSLRRSGRGRWSYAAAFVAEHMEARRLGAALDDESVDRATEEGEALADWELERRIAREP